MRKKKKLIAKRTIDGNINYICPYCKEKNKIWINRRDNFECMICHSDMDSITDNQFMDILCNIKERICAIYECIIRAK